MQSKGWLVVIVTTAYNREAPHVDPPFCPKSQVIWLSGSKAMWIGLLRILIKFWTNTYTKASGHIFPAGFDDTADASTTNGSRFQKRNIPESRIFHCGELSSVDIFGHLFKLPPVQGPHEGPQEHSLRDSA